jgi:hypothetical protein
VLAVFDDKLPFSARQFLPFQRHSGFPKAVVPSAFNYERNRGRSTTVEFELCSKDDALCIETKRLGCRLQVALRLLQK